MKKHYIVLIAILAIMFVWANSGVAQKRALLRRFVPEKGPGAGVSVGIMFPALEEVNDHAEAMGLEPMEDGIVLWGGTFRYAFSRKFQIGYYGAFGKECTESVFDDNIVKSLTLNVHTHLATVVYKFYREDWDVTIGANGGYYYAELLREISSDVYQEDSGDPNIDYYTFRSQLAGGTLGGCGFLGVKYRYNPLFAIGMDLGYQYANIELNQAGKTIDQAPEMDLSGIRLRMSVDLHY
jgi:hypothetical protein